MRSRLPLLAIFPATVLTIVLGARELAEVLMSEDVLNGGEMILLCSDGLHGVVDDDVLQQALSTGGAPSQIVASLMESALARGARDNITAVVARYDGE